jgi:hypothetical protein
LWRARPPYGKLASTLRILRLPSEQTVVTAVGEVAKLTRQAQQAAYEDAQAFFSGVDQLASAKYLGEPVQIYVGYMRNRSDVAMARARTSRDLFTRRQFR